MARKLLAGAMLACASLSTWSATPPSPATGTASAAPSVYLEELTWTEVRDALRGGKTTIIIPVGGTEQSGPHIALGKHNARVHALAGQIAAALGNALVAPVLAYVPEGAVQPPHGHMRFAGTISVPEEAFKNLLEGSARSFKQHGFTDVVLIGDHGGYQNTLSSVAIRLNKEWAAGPARAHYIADYYQAADQAFAQALRAKGYTDAQIGSHAGLADTALTLALAPALVRPAPMQTDLRDKARTGVTGDPRGATAEMGRPGVAMIVAKTVAAVRAAQAEKR